MRVSKLQFLYAPADTIADVGDKTSVQDIIDLMGESDAPETDDKKDDKTPDDKDKDKSGDDTDKLDTKDKKDDEELELDENLDDDKEVEDELEFAPHVGKKEILKAYPDLFKKFPSLERAYYKATQYEELFPTMQDAKTASEESREYDSIKTQLINGNTEDILKAVKEGEPKAFGKIVDNYLGTLQKVDQNAFIHVTSAVAKDIIVAMVREADSSKNENIKAAAVILNQFLFGKSDFVPQGTFSKQPANPEIDNERKALEDERRAIVQEKFNSAESELTNSCRNIVKSNIANYIDPRGVMTDYVRNTAIREALSKVEELVGNDDRFGRLRDKLWEKALSDGFSKRSKDAIKSAYLNKVKTVLKEVVQQARNAALKGSGKRADSTEEPTRRGPITVGRSSQSSSTKTSDKNAIPRGMKTLDYFNMD